MTPKRPIDFFKKEQMKNIKVTINGIDLITETGKTILQVVRENNLDEIPTLCHDDRVEPYGSCFL